MRKAGVIIAVSGLLAATALAQVEVLEPGSRSSVAQSQSAPGYSEVRPSRPPQAATSSSELFYQMQVMQDELMKLRGIVEEQGEQLRQLKQQRLDDYISLDRRLGALGAGSVPPAQQSAPEAGVERSTAQGVPYFGDATTPANDATPQTLPRVASQPQRKGTVVPTANEERSYQNAYALIREQKFDQATTAFNDFLVSFPTGAYAGNAHYWLAELYLLDGDNSAARTHFETVINDYRDNRKMPDALFKLGRIYHQEGDKARAKELLQRVVTEYGNSDSSAPRQASDYLKNNF